MATDRGRLTGAPLRLTRIEQAPHARGPDPREARLNSGIPPTEVAAWAGHSVEVLMRTYAKCMIGLEDVWITRMDVALHLEGADHEPQ